MEQLFSNRKFYFAPTEIPGFLSQMESAQEVTFYTLVFVPIKYKSMTYTLASHQCGRMVLNGQFGMSLLITILITLHVPDHSNCLQPTLLNNLKITLWCFSSTVANYLLVVHHLWITEHFKNTRTLKFKSQLTFGFLLPSIILTNLLGNRTLLKRVQKVMVCDLWLVDFDPFCVFLCFKVRCLWS